MTFAAGSVAGSARLTEGPGVDSLARQGEAWHGSVVSTNLDLEPETIAMGGMIGRLRAEREATEAVAREGKERRSFEAGQRWAKEFATEQQFRIIERSMSRTNPSPAASAIADEYQAAAAIKLDMWPDDIDGFDFRRGAMEAWQAAKGQL